MIKILWDLRQGSQEWLDLRKNKISATDAYDLLNGKSIDQILKEKQNSTFAGNGATERGHLLEEQARDIFKSLHPELSIKEAGAILNDDFPNALISPDGVINNGMALLEIKSFEKSHHEDIIKNLDPHFLAQIQMQMLISECQFVEGIFFNPEEEDPKKAFVTQRFYADNEIQAKLRTLLSEDSITPEEVNNDGLQIITLQRELQNYENRLAQEFEDYQNKKQQLEDIKTKLKSQTKGKLKTILTDDLGNTLDISIYDSDKITCVNPSIVPEEYTSEEEIPNAYVKQGKIYQRVPNTQLVKNYFKAGKSLPEGFENHPTRNIRLKFNGKAI